MPSTSLLISKNSTVNPFVRSAASATQVEGQRSPVKDGVWERCYLAREVQALTQSCLPGADPMGILQVTVAVVK